MDPFPGSCRLGNVGDSNATGRNLRSTVGDCGADFGVQKGAGGELDFLMCSRDSFLRLPSDQIPAIVKKISVKICRSKKI